MEDKDLQDSMAKTLEKMINARNAIQVEKDKLSHQVKELNHKIKSMENLIYTKPAVRGKVSLTTLILNYLIKAKKWCTNKEIISTVQELQGKKSSNYHAALQYLKYKGLIEKGFVEDKTVWKVISYKESA